jgi:putative oxidoreductase
MTQAALATLAVRILLVLLFFPFSALDKMLGFRSALAQAREIAPGGVAAVLVLLGLAVEIVMPLGVLTGTADRAAGFLLAGYCIVTALLWKRFWQPGDFWAGGADSKGRALFWDFLKNLSLAGGFLLLVVGAHGGFGSFLANPLASSQPYAEQASP